MENLTTFNFEYDDKNVKMILELGVNDSSIANFFQDVDQMVLGHIDEIEKEIGNKFLQLLFEAIFNVAKKYIPEDLRSSFKYKDFRKFTYDSSKGWGEEVRESINTLENISGCMFSI